MTTTASTPTAPTAATSTPGTPANPAKGNLRGQTTLAAEIDRWQTLASNLAPQISQMPGLQDQFTQFQTLLAAAIAVRSQINTLQADTANAFTQRNQLLLDGGDLFSRLSLALRAVHGPASPRLKAYGLKPRQPTGRPRKTATPPPVTPPPPTVEVATVHPPATTAPTASTAPLHPGE
jgi:hypothetical protein